MFCIFLASSVCVASTCSDMPIRPTGRDGSRRPDSGSAGSPAAANIASTLVTAFAGATGAIIGLAENFAKTAEEVQNFSARTGIAEDNVSRLMFVAKESAIPIEALQKGLKNAAQQAAAAGKTFQDFLLDEADRFASAADGAAGDSDGNDTMVCSYWGAGKGTSLELSKRWNGAGQGGI